MLKRALQRSTADEISFRIAGLEREVMVDAQTRAADMEVTRASPFWQSRPGSRRRWLSSLSHRCHQIAIHRIVGEADEIRVTVHPRMSSSAMSDVVA